jgi:hypothetical protein
MAFERAVDQALSEVKKILDNTKHPQIASKVPHSYDDKFMLAEFLTNSALSSQFTSLSQLGVTVDQLSQMVEFAKTRALTLRFSSTTRCKFNRHSQREEDSKTKQVTEVTSTFGGGMFESKVVRTIDEYFWDYDMSIELVAFAGTGEAAEDRITISGRESHHEMMTTTDRAPSAEIVISPPIEVNITDLLSTISSGQCELSFKIDREHKDAHTPYRNPDIDKVLAQLAAIKDWSAEVQHFLMALSRIQTVDQPVVDVEAARSQEGIFIPILPLLEERDSQAEPAAGEMSATDQLVVALPSGARAATCPLMWTADANQLLEEERKSLQRRIDTLGQVFPSVEGTFALLEASMVSVLTHINRVVTQYAQSVLYIEKMLYEQLVAAIGKVSHAVAAALT